MKIQYSWTLKDGSRFRTLFVRLRAMLPALQDVTRAAWDMAELYVIDPDGNLIKFGQPIDNVSSSRSRLPNFRRSRGCDGG